MKHNNLSRVCLCIACALLVHCLCIACASVKHTTTETELHTIEYRDTTHVEVVTNWFDTTHTEQQQVEHLRIVEHYDPTTGVLQQRILEIDKEMRAVMDEYQRQAQELAALRAQMAEQKDENIETEDVKETKPASPPWWLYVGYIFGGIVVLLIIRKVFTSI